MASFAARYEGACRRIVRILGPLLLCVLSLGPALAAPSPGTALAGGWREARPGDTPARLLAEFRDDRLPPFDPALLHRFPHEGQGSWAVIAPQPPWVGEERVLTIYPPLLGRVTVYGGDGPPATLALDDFGAHLHGHGRLAFALGAQASASAPILLKFEPGPTIAAPVSFRLLSADDFQREDARWLVFATACFAVMLAMALMALCFALILRDAAFVWYAGYIASYVVVQGIQTGYLFHPLQLEWLAGSGLLVGSAAVALSVAFASLFMAGFCDLRRHAPLLRMPVLALGIGMPLVVALRASQVPLLVEAAQTLVNPLLMLGTLLLLLAAVVAAARGSRPACFFLAGWTPLLALTAMSSAQVSGALPGLTWLNDASVAAGAFEALVLSLGLADRALTSQRDRDAVRGLADNDALTGVFNRRAWSEAAGNLLAGANGRPVALLFLDLDHFKQLNDQQGHAAGDRALVAVADALRTELRPDDLLGRYGGEEFVAMLGRATLEQAMQVATRLCRRIHRLEIPVDGLGLMLSASVGVAMRFPDDRLDALVERADQAMYQAKLGGRNHARPYHRPAADEARQRWTSRTAKGDTEA
ncbi:diguanylate cyclase [Frateuria sp. Soil773]|uniref:GGDEF domain-containing protein n=1 Tax=Frateuria sp. Soil773 TaxID=1736407 RepID=UPI0006FAC688|nr:diguanylate cyclase [Frateuria sp. Soil773]KRE89527.1 diguanylate cyclase [Frateuria sp. Soil773]